MKIVVTGSLGNISKPLSIALVKKGHAVTIISSKAERKEEIEQLGAIAAIGSMQDPQFLAETFKGADIVYAMEALGAGSFFDHALNFIEANTQIGRNYKEAITRSGVKHVVHLSSIGAHMEKGNGILKFHYNVEKILNELPQDVLIKFIRPVGFYYNMFAFVPVIKSAGCIIQNYGGDEVEPWVSPTDIAETIAEEMELPFIGRSVRYVASDEASPNTVAKILGEAIGKPELEWCEIKDEEFLNNLVKAGMNPETARGYMEMNAARRGGVLYEDYQRNRPVIGKIKLENFAKSFAAVYKQ